MNLQAIQQLHRNTNFGMSECKKALISANGNYEKALLILKEKGRISAKQRVYRLTRNGIISHYVHDNLQLAVLVEIHCETEVAASTKVFKDFAQEIAMHIAAEQPKDIPTLLNQPYYKEESISVEEFIFEFIALLRENIIIKRFVCFEIGKNYE
ncbi:MAG: hypothetical protein ACPKNR_01310 [Pleomorphochaeta sp.]